MSKRIILDSRITDTVSNSANFDLISLSARPIFTHISNENFYSGVSASRVLFGYNFDTTTAILLSSNSDVPFFTTGPGLTAFNLYNSITSVSTNSTPWSGLELNYPEISGFPISTYVINNYNTLTLNIPTLTAADSFDIIIINPAGYGKFSVDVSNIGVLTII
jgi:hypothetical protein